MISMIKATFFCLAHALIIGMARMNGHPKYKSYRNGRGMKQSVEDFLNSSGIKLRNAGGVEELRQFQEYLSDYKIIVYDGFSPDRVMFSGNSVSLSMIWTPNTTM